jgi:hypothetical protein
MIEKSELPFEFYILDCLGSYRVNSENLSLTFIKIHCCYAELGSASRFVLPGEILKQVQDDGSVKFQISLARI